MAQAKIIRLDASWDAILNAENKHLLEEALPGYLKEQRWFGGKAGTISSVTVQEAVRLVDAPPGAYLVLLGVQYAEGTSQTYALPLTFASGEQVADLEARLPGAVVATLQTDGASPGVLYDASSDKGFAGALLDAIRDGRYFSSASGEVVAAPTEAFGQLAPPPGVSLEPKVMSAEQSNTSIRYGDCFILKLYRRLEEGTNPDLEIGRFLLSIGFPNVPPLAGSIEYRGVRQEPVTLGILQGFIPNNGDAWAYTLEALDGYMDNVLRSDLDPGHLTPPYRHPLDLLDTPVPAEIGELMAGYLDSARLLGRRTAEMHMALASENDNPDFKPEPFSMEYQRSLYESVQRLAGQALDLLGRHEGALPPDAQPQARALLDNPGLVTSRFESLLSRQISAEITRCHGDYHLGQVLYTGKDFVIIDFEGEPVRSLAERRRKHSPLKDVAGMLRSFHYAAHSAAFKWQGKRDAVPATEQWASVWHDLTGAAFLAEYLSIAAQGTILPQSLEDLRMLLDVFILEKAVYELVYELNNRPGWVGIPLSGIAQLVLPQAD